MGPLGSWVSLGHGFAGRLSRGVQGGVDLEGPRGLVLDPHRAGRLADGEADSYSSVRLSWSPMRRAAQVNSGMGLSYHRAPFGLFAAGLG